MTQAQHQTQLGPQQGIGVVSNKDDGSTRIPTAPTSALPGSPSSSLTPQLSQATTDVSLPIPDADKVATGTTTEAPIGAVSGGEVEDEESSEPLIQTLITPQQSPPSTNRYTIASAIIPTATRTTIASTVSEYGSAPEKNVQEGEQTEGGVNGNTAGDHPATSSATSMATSTLDNVSADTSNPEADTPASYHLLMSNASYMSDDHVKHQADIDPSTEGVKSSTEHLLETIKDLGKVYPHHQPQLQPGLGPMDVPVEMASETIVYAVPSIGSEHYSHEEDPSLESTLLSSQEELSDSTISLSQGKQESKHEELATANPSDSMTAVLLDTIQPLLSHASPPSALPGSQNVQGDGINTMESDQGTTLGDVVASLAPNNIDGDLTTAPILNSFDADMEMGSSTSMDLDIDTDASGLLNSDTAVGQGVLDIEQETDMSVDPPDVVLPSEIPSRELMYDAASRDDKDQQLVEATVGQVANEENGGDVRDSNEDPTMAIVEMLGTQGDVTTHLDATHAGYAEVIQSTEDKDVGLGLPDSAGDLGLLQSVGSISTQDTPAKVDEDYTNEDFVKTLLMESVPVAEPVIPGMGMADTEALSTEAPDLFKTLLGDVLSTKPELMECSLPMEATRLEITEATPEDLPVNDTNREKPVMVTEQTVNPAIEEAEPRHSALEVVDRTADQPPMNKSPLDDESVKTMPETNLSYVAETDEIQDVSETMSDVDTDGPQTVPNVKSLEPTSAKDVDERVHTRGKSPLSSSVMIMPAQRRRSATSPTVSRQGTADSHQSVSPFPGRSRHQLQRDHFPPSPAPHPSWHFVPGADLALLSEMTASTADLRRFRREMQWLEERTQRPRRGTVSEQVLDKALGLTRNVPPPPLPQTKPQHQRTRDERGKGGIGNTRFPPDLGSTTVQLSTESRLALSMLKMDLLSDQEEQTRLERDQEALKRSLARVEAKVSEKKKAQEAAEQEIQEMLERHPAMETELLRVRQLENECMEMREQQRQQAESEIRKLEATLQMLKQQREQGQAISFSASTLQVPRTAMSNSAAPTKEGGYLRPGPIESFVSKGLKTYDYYFDLPLKHTDPSCKDTIVVFARKVIAVDKQDDSAKMPWLIFFQGGPGFQGPAYNTGWVKMAASTYNVLLLDQRGTGLSTPMTVQLLSQFKTAQEQADYFMQFRADSIVRDSELIRETLLADCADKKWSLLGQSYGGFCITTYLSMFPDSLTAAYITGGIPPVFDTLDDVYRKCYKSVMEHTERYYKRFPMDIKRIKKIMRYLATHDVKLPAGGRLTPRRFQQLGMRFGLSGGMDYVHSLCLQAFVSFRGQEVLSSQFLDELAFQEQIPPIYAILHESIYCDGPGVASNWTASRLLQGEFSNAFEYSVKAFEGLDEDDDKLVYFTGEHMYDWMLDDYSYLEPLKECADILAKHTQWPKLYNPEVLAQNKVPVAAAVFYDDMYVARECSEKAAKGIKGIQLWVTNEYMHSGLRDSEGVLTKLFKMVSGEVDVPVA
ncbi:hypothetical protein BGX34_012136 [Mortierella sp. NVP85]|nr:hypothetical protein BGX34_012136 [Mortierella sp. NVP85]